MSTCYDSRVVYDLIDQLRARGAVKMAFHADGALASVEFASPIDTAPASSAPQHDTPTPASRAKRATGGLVPRGAIADHPDG